MPVNPAVKTVSVIGGLGCCLGVGLLAFLVAMGIPGFLAEKCREKQGDAQGALSDLWTAESKFHAANGFYTSDLVAVGWKPAATSKYVVGFSAPGPGMRRSEILKTRIQDYDERRDSSASLGGAVVVAGSASLPAQARVRRDGYVAAAVGNIDGDATLDVWTTDENGQQRNVTNDCTE